MSAMKRTGILCHHIAVVGIVGVVVGLLAASPADAARRRRKNTRKAPDKTEQIEEPAAPVDEIPSTGRGPSRIEFDDRLVQGQTNKANAIYLFERRESALRSLLKKRSNFHDEIDEMLNDELVR